MKQSILALTFLFVGCTLEPEIQIQEVYIPVKCDVEIPEPPDFKKNVSFVEQYREYVIKLRTRLEACTQ